MKAALFLFLVIFNVFIIYSQDDQEKVDNLCKGCFSSIGIKDFTIGSSKDQINASLILIDDEIKFIDSYYFVDTIQLNKKKENEITYYLNFINETLIDYNFIIKGNRELYEWVMEKLDKGDKKLFSGFENTINKYSFFSKKEYCKRYILLSRIAHDKEYIKGGVSAN